MDRTAYGTYLYFAKPGSLETILLDYRQILMDNFHKMRIDPKNPKWPDRDRFVLSAGHASMLLYSLLHLSGFNLSLDQIRAFRQWGSHTPGHPELDPDRGIETTTGPLGQGFATGVGMAMAEAHLRANNRHWMRAVALHERGGARVRLVILGSYRDTEVHNGFETYYAVVASDLHNGVAELRVVEEVTAGEVPRHRLTPGCATRFPPLCQKGP